MRALFTNVSSLLVFFSLFVAFTFADVLENLDLSIGKSYIETTKGDTKTNGVKIMNHITKHFASSKKLGDVMVAKGKGASVYKSQVTNGVKLIINASYTTEYTVEEIRKDLNNIVTTTKATDANHKWIVLIVNDTTGVHCRSIAQWYEGSKTPKGCPSEWEKAKGKPIEVEVKDLNENLKLENDFAFNNMVIKRQSHVLYIVMDLFSLKAKREKYRKRIRNLDWSKNKVEIIKQLSKIHSEFQKFCEDFGVAIYVKDTKELAEKFVEDTGGSVKEYLEQFRVQQNTGFTATGKLIGKIFADKSAGVFADHSMSHEVMHLMSAEDGITKFRSEWSNSVQEGVTDYLTRLVAPSKNPEEVADRFYQQQAQMMQALAEKSEKAFKDMAQAYFGGTTSTGAFEGNFKSAKKNIIDCFNGGSAPRFEKVANERDIPFYVSRVNKKDGLGLVLKK